MATSYIEPFLSEDEEEYCPLCIEPMDLSDKHFKPCPCGYQVCQFCYNNIRENPELNGNCPACRRKYDDESVQYVILSPEELKLEQSKQAKKEKERKLRDKERKENENANRKQLANMRVIQKNLVYVVGLNPSVPYEEVAALLKSDRYFGQYGKITKIVVNRKENGSNQGYGVYVTFSKKDEAYRCISQVDGTYWDGRIIKAAYGTTKYCSSYLRGQSCPNPNCMFLHEPGEEAEYFNRHGSQTSSGRSGGYTSTSHHSALPKTVPPLRASAPSNAADTEHIIHQGGVASHAGSSPNLAHHYAQLNAPLNSSSSSSSNATPLSAATGSHAIYHHGHQTNNNGTGISNSSTSSPATHHLQLNTTLSSSASSSSSHHHNQQLAPAGIPNSNPWGSVKPSTQPSVNPWLSKSSANTTTAKSTSSSPFGSIDINEKTFPIYSQMGNNGSGVPGSSTSTNNNAHISNGLDATSRNGSPFGSHSFNSNSQLNGSSTPTTPTANFSTSADYSTIIGGSGMNNSNSNSNISPFVGNQNLFTGLPMPQATLIKNGLKRNANSSTAINSKNSNNKDQKDKEKENSIKQIHPYDPSATAIKLLDDAIDYLSSFKNSSISLRASIFRNENEQLRYQSMPPLFSFEDITPAEKSDDLLRKELIKMLSVEPVDMNNLGNNNTTEILHAMGIPAAQDSPQNAMMSPMVNGIFPSPQITPEQHMAQQQLLMQQQQNFLLQQHQQQHQQQQHQQQQQQQQFAPPQAMIHQPGQQIMSPMGPQSVKMNNTNSSNSSDLLNQLNKGKKASTTSA